jgi:hypothetical protein
MVKNQVWSKTKYVQRNIVKLDKISQFSMCYNQFGAGNTGSRYFIYEYFSSLKFHNPSIKFNSFKRKNTNVSPFLTLEFGNFDYIKQR